MSWPERSHMLDIKASQFPAGDTILKTLSRGILPPNLPFNHGGRDFSLQYQYIQQPSRL
jgi:hypothetical protein